MLTFGRTYTSTQVLIYVAEHTHVYVKADCDTQYILQVWTLALTKHHFYYFYSKAECLSSPKLMILSSLSKCYSTTNIHFQFEHQHKNIKHENPQPKPIHDITHSTHRNNICSRHQAFLFGYYIYELLEFIFLARSISFLNTFFIKT